MWSLQGKIDLFWLGTIARLRCNNLQPFRPLGIFGEEKLAAKVDRERRSGQGKKPSEKKKRKGNQKRTSSKRYDEKRKERTEKGEERKKERKKTWVWFKGLMELKGTSSEFPYSV